MKDLIQRLDSWLQENRSAYYEFLQPGLTDAEIIEFEKALDVDLPEDFKRFYQWKNGTSGGRDQPRSGYGSLLPNFRWMSDQEVIDNFNTWKEVMAEHDFSEDWWRPGWVTFLTDSTANEYCLDIEGSFGGKKGQIISMWSDDTPRTIIHPNFYKWLETVVLALEKGFFTGDESDKHLDSYDNYLELLKENNPGYPIWNEAL